MKTIVKYIQIRFYFIVYSDRISKKIDFQQIFHLAKTKGCFQKTYLASNWEKFVQKMTKNKKINGFMQYTDVGVRHQMGPQAQALHIPAAPLPAQAAWALASSQPDLEPSYSA